MVNVNHLVKQHGDRLETVVWTMLARVAETKDSREGGREPMTTKGKDTHGGYVPAERLFVPAVAMPGIVNIDDMSIEKVLRVGGMLREMGDVDGAFSR